MKCLACQAAELTLPEAGHAWICGKCKCAFNVKAVAEIERLRGMMIPLVFEPLHSEEWGTAMDAIGYYVTDEFGITAAEAAKEQPDD